VFAYYQLRLYLPVVGSYQAFLVVDFAARGLNLDKYSLLDGISKTVVELFSIDAMPVNQAPKSFTARIGFFIICIIFCLVLINFMLTAKLLAGTIAASSLLEAATTLGIDYNLYSLYTKICTKK
jgi:hypothetical protein